MSRLTPTTRAAGPRPTRRCADPTWLVTRRNPFTPRGSTGLQNHARKGRPRTGRRIRAGATLPAAITLVAASCGGDDDDSAGTAEAADRPRPPDRLRPRPQERLRPRPPATRSLLVAVKAAGPSRSATATSPPASTRSSPNRRGIQAESRGYEFVEGSANGDCDRQVQDVENFVAQSVDASSCCRCAASSR